MIWFRRKSRPFEGWAQSYLKKLEHDPLASKTEWTLIRRHSWVGLTGHLKRRSPTLLCYRPRLLKILISSLFLFAGLFHLSDKGFVANSGLSLWIPLLFVGIGLGSLVIAYTPRVFDLNAGVFRYGWRPPEQPSSYDNSPLVLLRRIHALQILGEEDDEDYECFELNLVLDNGRRIYLSTYDNSKIVRHDANLLADALSVPIWDTLTLSMGV